MKKIIGGITALILAIGLVSGVAFALFSSTVNINGMVLGTATPTLEISLDGSVWGNSITPPADAINPLIPGDDDWGRIYLRNVSDASLIDPVNFELSGRLTSASGDWGVLNDKIEAVIYEEGNATYDTPGSGSSGWHTLADWNATHIDMGSTLDQGVDRAYIVRFRLIGDPGSSVSGKTLTDVNWEIVGTQIATP